VRGLTTAGRPRRSRTLAIVLATANHWWFDAFTGALTAGAAALVAVLFARWRPAAWSWVPPARATARPQAV
jgi:hypothetical protein